MTTKEMAKKWDCSVDWVRQRCVEGMIPLAEKQRNRKWDIPETVCKPPCTRHRAVVLLQLLLEKAEGNDVELFPGNDYDTNEKIYGYLAENGFITRFQYKKMEKNLDSAKVLRRGKELIESATVKRKKHISKRTTVSAEADAKIAKFRVEHERNSQTDE
ncbi:MAG: hypothetical protein J6O61_08765 [Butyrivibrio sp.]|uniref:hypothetical protein n=1 Tax=Butyrivibrio sp. TaxID=28121 RepID=UPI001B13E748|nr:hypothetical protein [Butyrivibrio sp.]MBO6240901.1 hypothetical protein [Butyrivibrio sp.]